MPKKRSKNCKIWYHGPKHAKYSQKYGINDIICYLNLVSGGLTEAQPWFTTKKGNSWRWIKVRDDLAMGRRKKMCKPPKKRKKNPTKKKTHQKKEKEKAHLPARGSELSTPGTDQEHNIDPASCLEPKNNYWIIEQILWISRSQFFKRYLIGII